MSRVLLVHVHDDGSERSEWELFLIGISYEELVNDV